jgi:hypothetical protein
MMITSIWPPGRAYSFVARNSSPVPTRSVRSLGGIRAAAFPISAGFLYAFWTREYAIKVWPTSSWIYSSSISTRWPRWSSTNRASSTTARNRRPRRVCYLWNTCGKRRRVRWTRYGQATCTSSQSRAHDMTSDLHEFAESSPHARYSKDEITGLLRNLVKSIVER